MNVKHGFVIPGKQKPYLLAHRGNPSEYPENTLAAFKRAYADGADIVETDLWLSADGEFVCIHDATVDRTTDGSGMVAEMRVDELKTLRVVGGGKTAGDDRIPTLREMLAEAPQDVVLALELKSDLFLQPNVAERLVVELETMGIRSRVLILSFSIVRLQQFKKVAPDIPVGLVSYCGTWPHAGVDVLGPFWPLLLANPYYVWLAHLRNQAVCPLDPNPDPRLWLYCLAGCDAVLTDNSALTGRKLRRWRKLFSLLH